MATIDAIFDTNALVHVVRNLKTPSQFILDTFFPNVVEFETEFVSIDVDVGLRRMAPFVSPLVEGRPVESRKYQTNTFRPAYIKDLRTPDFRKPVLRAMGERIGGEMTAAQRIQLNLAYEMQDQIEMVQRRLEWMAVQGMTYGSLTIAGDGFEAVTVNFGRASALSVDVSSTGTNVPWSGATTGNNTPANCLELWSQLVLQKSGRAPTDVVFTTGAFNLFLTDTRVQQSVWYQRSGDSKVDFGGTQPVQGAVFKGEWGGFRLWVYNDWFVDQIQNVSWSSSATTFTIPSGSTLAVGATLAPGNGIADGTVVTGISGTTVTIGTATTAAASGVALSYEVPMLPANYLLMSSPALEGVRAFGSIMDDDFNYAAMAYAPKTWVPKNPARRHLLMQSAPIVIPSRVNACLAAKVA